MRHLFLSLLLLWSAISSAQSLYLYGGKEHDVFLGCLTCNDFNSKSVWNEYSLYGNSYNSKSIWNDCGKYGSEYSNYSPWNAAAMYPPVVVDADGNFYGYLTVNEYKSDRAEFDLALYLYEYYDFIRDDVSKWYKKIFESY